MAARAFARAVALSPSNSEAHALLVWSLLQSDMLGPASAALRTAVGADGGRPVSGTWWPHLAALQLHAGRSEPVHAEFQRQLTVLPEVTGGHPRRLPRTHAHAHTRTHTYARVPRQMTASPSFGFHAHTHSHTQHHTYLAR